MWTIVGFLSNETCSPYNIVRILAVYNKSIITKTVLRNRFNLPMHVHRAHIMAFNHKNLYITNSLHIEKLYYNCKWVNSLEEPYVFLIKSINTVLQFSNYVTYKYIKRRCTSIKNSYLYFVRFIRKCFFNKIIVLFLKYFYWCMHTFIYTIIIQQIDIMWYYMIWYKIFSIYYLVLQIITQ